MKLNHPISPSAALLSGFEGFCSRAFSMHSNHPQDGPALYETAEAWILRMDLPGWRREDISLAIEGPALRLNARTDSPGNEFQSAIARSFRLPEGVDTQKVSARLELGVLEITIPKTESEIPSSRQVEIH